jgi:hypothetical protein
MITTPTKEINRGHEKYQDERRKPNAKSQRPNQDKTQKPKDQDKKKKGNYRKTKASTHTNNWVFVLVFV